MHVMIYPQADDGDAGVMFVNAKQLVFHGNTVGAEGERKEEKEEGLERGRQKESERGRERVTHSVRAYPQEGIYHWPMNLLARIRHAIRQQLFNRSILYLINKSQMPTVYNLCALVCALASERGCAYLLYHASGTCRSDVVCASCTQLSTHTHTHIHANTHTYT